ncbi:MAG: thioredoxin family protein [Polyangiaceae bacterium]
MSPFFCWLVVGCGAREHEVVDVDVGTSSSAVTPILTESTSTGTAPATSSSPRELTWRSDLDGAWRDAEARRAPLLVVVLADWSVASREVQAHLAEASFTRSARPFITVKLDATTDDGTIDEKLVRIGARSIPSLALIDPATGRRDVLSWPWTLAELDERVLAFVGAR